MYELEKEYYYHPKSMMRSKLNFFLKSAVSLFWGLTGLYIMIIEVFLIKDKIPGHADLLDVDIIFLLAALLFIAVSIVQWSRKTTLKLCINILLLSVSLLLPLLMIMASAAAHDNTSAWGMAYSLSAIVLSLVSMGVSVAECVHRKKAYI